jgi:hypothetical protein
MNDFQDKLEYNINDLHSLIDNEIEESIHLDYKEASALDKSDGKKKEISKDVSAFANSDGGIIIYGIKEKNHKAFEITYIDGDIFTKEWLEQTINSSIQRRIPEIKIYPIRNNGNIKESIYVVKIPKSYEVPHLCKDKRFYKRFNFESVPMEEYEIRQLYGQKLKSKLVIGGYSVGRTNKDNNGDNKIKFVFEVSVINDGDITEADYKVNVYFINYNNLIEITWPQNQQQYNFTSLGDHKMKISSNGQTSIYPNENVNAVRFNFEIPKNKIMEAIGEVKIEVLLFYSNGEDKREFDLKKLTDDMIKLYGA